MKTCHVSGFGSVPREVSVEKPDGTVEITTRPCNQKLPDARMFDLSAQLKAGVQLQEVNTKILGSGVSTEELAGAVNQVARKSKSKQSQPAEEAKE
jgi:hypothetical protein